MNLEKLVSVIIPVYNAELHLADCIESVLNQTYPWLELILVNDGSADNSGGLCEAYAKKDSRIKVIHQTNSGPSVARNKGLDAATGHYIQFVDSDDAIDLQMTERLVQAIDGCQLVICGYTKVFEKNEGGKTTKPFRIKPTGGFTKEEFLEHFGELYPYNYIHYNWNKLYIASIIKDEGIAFETNVDWGEDLLFNLRYLDKCRSLCLIEDPLYYYLDSNAGSITSKFRPDLFPNMQMLQGTAREFLKRNNAYKGKNKILFERFYTNRILANFWNLFHPNSTFTAAQKKKYISKIVHDERVIQSIGYFRSGSLDKRLVGILVKRKSVQMIYLYYLLKSFWKKKMGPKEEKWI